MRGTKAVRVRLLARCCALLLASLVPATTAAKRGRALLGHWEAVAIVVRGKPRPVRSAVRHFFEFRGGGKLVAIEAAKKLVNVAKHEGRWSIKGRKLLMTLEGSTKRMGFAVRGKTLKLYAPNGVMILERRSASAIPVSAADIKRARALEATEGLDKLKVGAKSYYLSDRYDANATLLAHRFPPGSTAWVPPVPCCKQPGKRCKPQPKRWRAPPWLHLAFQLSDPHYFQWRYAAKGVGKRATVIIEARGDLDCDGKYSHYRVSGKIGPKGRPVFGPLRKRNPLE